MREQIGTKTQGKAICTSAASATLFASVASNFNHLCRFGITWSNVSAPGAGGSLITIYEGDNTNSNSVWAFVPSTTFGTMFADFGDEGFAASAAGTHFSTGINSGGTVNSVFTGFYATYA